MGKRSPNYWRAFWITVAAVGAVNVALFAYYASRPLIPTGKPGRPFVKVRPDWTIPFDLMNLPGAAVLVVVLGPPSEGQSGFCAAISTVFWGAVAVGIEWLFVGNRRHVSPPAPPPDRRADSN